MVLFFSPLFSLFFIYFSCFPMEKVQELPISRDMDLKIKKEVPSLETLCFKELSKFSNERLFESPKFTTALKQLFLERFRYRNAVSFFYLFGKLYNPTAIPYKLPCTMLSVDKKYFFEFDELITQVYQLVPLGLEYLHKIEGKLIAVSIDSKYLLIEDAKGHFFVELGTWRTVASYNGTFDKTKDALVLNPEGGGSCYLVSNCFTKEDMEAYWENFDYIYKADLEKLKTINSDHYVFDINGKGIQLKHLQWGETIKKNGVDRLVFPLSIIFSDDKSLALIQRPFREPGMSDPKKVVLCKPNGEKIIFRYNAHATAFSSTGRYVSLCNGDTLSAYDLSNLEVNWNPGMYAEKIIWENNVDRKDLATHTSISPDGRYALMLSDPNCSWSSESSDKDKEGLVVYLCDLKTKSGYSMCESLTSIVYIKKGKIRHVGFFDNGRKFFICADKFYIYNMTDFAPREGIVVPNNFEYPILIRLLPPLCLIEDNNKCFSEHYLHIEDHTLISLKSHLAFMKDMVAERYAFLMEHLDLGALNPEMKRRVLEVYRMQSLETFMSFFPGITEVEKEIKQEEAKESKTGCMIG